MAVKPGAPHVVGTSPLSCVISPPESPNLNAFGERFVGSGRRECLKKIVPIGVTHPRHALKEYLVHYHTERNHQGLRNELLRPAAASTREPANDNGGGRERPRERLGGLLSDYHREAA